MVKRIWYQEAGIPYRKAYKVKHLAGLTNFRLVNHYPATKKWVQDKAEEMKASGRALSTRIVKTKHGYWLYGF